MPKSTLFLLLCLLFFFSNAFSLADWTFQKEKDGIRVYSRPSQHSKFNEIKAEFNIKTNVAKLVSVISDIDKYPSWVYGVKTASFSKRLSSEEMIYYARVNAPWPASDRDYYNQIKIHIDPITKTVSISSHGVPEFKPTNAGIVRVPFMTANWTVTPIDNNTLHISYIVSVDPGGNVPPWLVNLFSTNGPIESFTGLKKRCGDS